MAAAGPKAKDFWVGPPSEGSSRSADGYQPSAMEVKYGFTRVIDGMEFEKCVDKVSWALKREGINVLTTIDVQKALLKNGNIDLGRKYVILGVNDPTIAHAALMADPSIGLLLPFNVVVMETDNLTTNAVQIQKPTALAALVGNTGPEVKKLLIDAEAKMSRAMDSLVESLKYNAQTKKWQLHWDWRTLELKV